MATSRRYSCRMCKDVVAFAERLLYLEPLNEEFKEHLLSAIVEWASNRYEARLNDVPVEHLVIASTSSDSDFDYTVSINSLVGPAPLRVKVVVGQDGNFYISD